MTTDAPAACVTNIGPRGIRLRRIIGLGGFVAGAALVGLQFCWHAPYSWRAFGFPCFLIGALGWFQARARTCLSNAARGVRDHDAEGLPTELDTAAIDAAIARQARSIRIRAFLVAAFLTALTFAFPVL